MLIGVSIPYVGTFGSSPFANLPLDRFSNVVWAKLGVEVWGGFLGHGGHKACKPW